MYNEKIHSILQPNVRCTILSFDAVLYAAYLISLHSSSISRAALYFGCSHCILSPAWLKNNKIKIIEVINYFKIKNTNQ